jgi:hypothetical protein
MVPALCDNDSMPGWFILRPGGLYTVDDIGSRFAFDTEHEAQTAITALGLEGEVVPFPLPDELPEGDALLLVPRRGEGCGDN